ncbi:unnamed protein product [Pylaiella littoralis]
MFFTGKSRERKAFGNMALFGKARPLLILLPLVFVGWIQLAGGAEQEATGVTATASMYDTRSSGAIDDFSGCYDDGCGPELTIDGLLNDEPESRWSCSESLSDTGMACYITYDLGSSFSLVKMSIYFYKSDDLDRTPNPFDISTSDDGTTFADSFDGENTPGTAIGVAQDFDFPTGASGQHVRLTAVLDADQWLSINEAIIYVDVVTPSPTAAIPSLEPTSAPTTTAATPPPVGITIDVATPSPAMGGMTAAPSAADPDTPGPAAAADPSTAPVAPTSPPSTPAPSVDGADPTAPTTSPTPAVSPGAATPAPTPGSRGDDDSSPTPGLTRAPVGNVTPSEAPVVVGSTGGGGGDSSESTYIIVGGVVGGAVVLLLIGVIAYKIRKVPPPPSYDDLNPGS